MSYNNDTEKLYLDFLNFSIEDESLAAANVNSFWRVEENDLLNTEKKLGFEIPRQLRDFYLNVGYGNLNVDKNKKWSDVYHNRIVEPSRLPKLWDKSDLDFNIDIDLVDEGELAFFDNGNQCFLVLRPFSDAPNTVYYPGDKIPLAQDFNEFILKLYENSTFYLEHEGEY